MKCVKLLHKTSSMYVGEELRSKQKEGKREGNEPTLDINLRFRWFRMLTATYLGTYIEYHLMEVYSATKEKIFPFSVTVLLLLRIYIYKHMHIYNIQMVIQFSSLSALSIYPLTYN